MLGKPVIRGTRIPVGLILRKLAEGATEADLLDAYPQLTREDIRAAIAYGSACSWGMPGTRSRAPRPRGSTWPGSRPGMRGWRRSVPPPETHRPVGPPSNGYSRPRGTGCCSSSTKC